MNGIIERKTFCVSALVLWTCAWCLSTGCGEDETGETSAAPDTVAEATPGPQPWTPPTMTERGLFSVRAIAHLHSAFSHDACDDQGLDEDGEPNATCIQRMKTALCEEHIAIAFMTDHPSFLRDQPFEDLLYAAEELGDEVLQDEAGHGWAVVFQCPEGQGGPDDRVRLRVGFEGTHTMPLGIRRHLSDPELYSVSFKSETPSEDLQALTAEVRAAGGLVAIAHSEQKDLDWETIAEHDVSAMELYNFHANFNEALDDIFEALKVLDPFVSQEPGAPDADLSALSVLGLYPLPALEKWRKVTAVRPITAFAGSDVHENVILPGLCVDGLCESLADDIPNLVGALETEGPLILSDGERIDSYGRIFRWVQNRLWIDPDGDLFADTQAAMESGRNQVVFEVLGDAVGVELVAAVGEGDEAVLSDTGATLTVADGATLWARTPDAPSPGRVATWTDGTAAEITGTIFRTDAQGTEAVLTWTGPSTWRSLPLDTPGAYQLEVTITPHHLAEPLGPSADLAEQTYRWVETNAIRCTE